MQNNIETAGNCQGKTSHRQVAASKTVCVPIEATPRHFALHSQTILRMPQVVARLGLSRSSIYAFMDPKSRSYIPTFPRPVRISTHAIGWVEGEIAQYVEERAKDFRN